MYTKTTHQFLLLLLVNMTLFSCQDPSTNNEPPYEGPPKDFIISTERAGELYDAYSQRRVPIIKAYEKSISEDIPEFEPTRYAEYDLATVKQYIAYIEHEATQAKVDIKTLRFYLSNYPDSDKFLNGDPVKYPRRNSFFVVPTMEVSGKNVGFSVEEEGGEYRAVPINRRQPTEEGNQDQNQKDSTGQMNEAGFFKSNNTTVQPGSTSLILNDSSITPPPGNNDFGNN